jgi:phospholipid/cholesterol/gamma-HCH transport system substrate-binding protein
MADRHALIRSIEKYLVFVIVGVFAIAIVVIALKPDSTNKLNARFQRAVGLYPGSSIRLHGIAIGSITKVKPDGDGVNVEMAYDKKIKLPAYPNDAQVVRAAIIPPSLVSDRYVELLDFSSCGGKCDVLPSGASIPMNQTASPVELDDIYAALDKLNVALGPKGANSAPGIDKNGPLSELINVGAANLDGNGKALGETVQKLSQAAKTLADGREDLFGTVKNLQVFTDALVANDAQVRTFNGQLAQVASELADERQSLGDALKNLAVALKDVSDFVKKNGDVLHTDIVGLKNITDILVKNRAALNEILAVAPAALANLVHTYNARSGTLDTRGNFGNLADPQILCGILSNIGALNTLSATIQSTCKKVSDSLGGLPLPLLGQPGSTPPPPCLPKSALPSIPGVTCR